MKERPLEVMRQDRIKLAKRLDRLDQRIDQKFREIRFNERNTASQFRGIPNSFTTEVLLPETH